MALDLQFRPRRVRSHAALRNLVRETRLHPHDFIYPVFVREGEGQKEEVKSMPGVFRHSLESLLVECELAADSGIQAIALFPCIEPSRKDSSGSFALSPENILFGALREVRKRFPELALVADVALDPYTNHGHDGILSADGNDVDNDATVELLCKLGLEEAIHGANLVAPSDMMDGRVGAIRRAMDAGGFEGTGILAYAAKFASAFYGPFRDAVGSKLKGDSISKSGYQLDPANFREAALEVALDIEQGADLVMVKPAGPYLDVICSVAEKSRVPVAAYQVSGEFAQIHAAAANGWLDYARARDESLLSIKRAGADVIVSYFAREFCEAFRVSNL